MALSCWMQPTGTACWTDPTESSRREAGDSRARTDVTFRQVGAYEAQIRARGAVVTKEDEALYAGVARAGAAFALHVFAAARAIPDEDYRIARKAGDAGF